MILVIFGTVSQTKKKSQQAEIEASTFRDSLNNPSSPYTFQRYTGDGFDSPRQSDAFSSNSIPYSKSFSLVCYECGSNITIDDKFCSNCGDSTKQEIEKHYSKY
jgi:Leucine-rich repeat (LRR) protein